MVTTPITCSDSYDHQDTQESCIRSHIIACGGDADHKDKGGERGLRKKVKRFFHSKASSNSSGVNSSAVAMASFETSCRRKLRSGPSVVIPAAPAAACGGSNKRALLCGVTYSHQHRYMLKGTANDVSNMKNLLTNTFGYPAECIRILSEDDPGAQDLIPTKKNIENSLKWLVEGCKWGDSLVFYFSGHGLRQPDFQNDELDGYDETICPVDFLKEGMILDNDINKTIVWPLKEGVKLHAIVDACHSGTILDLEHVYNRKQKSTSGGLAISISACEDDKMAADTTVFTKKEMNGAMTYILTKTVKENPQITYGGLLDTMANHIVNINSERWIKSRIIRKVLRHKTLQEPMLSSSAKFEVNDTKFIL
ncbi:metacaspase-1 isoform X4 [Prunus dulcis]|uniref:metacaspase-1 isoform X4 n=1 Tax=Prunus dulcis TaxID=3755 RepID=UPI001482D5B8|nr:metacaspase-1 isoform X4 [Prunus dulcis]